MLQEKLRELERLNVRPVAISVDSPGALAGLARDCGVTFPLPSDSGRETVRAWGVLNAAERGGIAVPSTFVLDEAGVVVYRSLDRIEARADVESVLRFLEEFRRDHSRRLDNQKRTFTLPGVWDLVTSYPRMWFGRR